MASAPVARADGWLRSARHGGIFWFGLTAIESCHCEEALADVACRERSRMAIQGLAIGAGRCLWGS